MIYKIVYDGLYPENLKGRLATISQIFDYPTRSWFDLGTPRQNFEFSEGKFFCSGAKAWNESLLQIRMSTFNRILKEFLKS